MSSLKKTVARKAAKSAAKHTARGTASKATRRPLRAVTLIGLGCVLGGFAGAAWGSRQP
jgi:hypothetical protein